MEKFPFPIKAVQTGPRGYPSSEFLKCFDLLVKELNIAHYFIYPRIAKQNSYVEASHLADENEFYRQGNMGCNIESMQKKLEEWEYVWNYFRLHQALNYLTPDEYLKRIQFIPLPTKNVIILQT